MSKNLTRKGLAFGTAVALAGAAFSAAPAFAAGELKLEVASGSGYAVPHTAQIELKTSVNTGYSSDELVYLKYKLETAGGFEVHSTSADASGVTVSAGADVAHTATSAVVADAAYSAGDGVNHIGLYIEDSASAAFAVTADSKTVTVTAFVDKDGDDVIDEGEWSAAQTVTFMDWDLVEATTVLTHPALGDATVEAKVTSSNVNVSESKEAFEVEFKSDTAGTDGTETDTSGTYSTSDNNLTFATAAATAAQVTADADDATHVPADWNGSTAFQVEAGSFSAQVQLSGASTVLGNKSTRVVSAADIDSIAATYTATGHTQAIVSDDVDARSGSGSVKVEFAATSAATAVADKTITIKIAENAVNSLASAASVTAGGKTLSNTSAATTQSQSFTAVTDADGKVSATINWTGAVSGNVIAVSAIADGITVTDTITFEDAAVATVYNTDVTGTTSQEIYVAKDTAFALNYAILDQFGALFTAANHSVEVSDATVTATAVVSGGKATVNFAGYAATGAKTMTVKVYKSSVYQTVTTTTELTVGSPNAATTVDLAAGAGDSFGTAGTPEALNLNTWTDADVRVGESAPTVANGNTVEAVLTDSNGNATQGSVTFSGAGLLFATDAQLFKAGSITVRTNASGLASVEVYSNKAGKIVLTATAGSASKTKDFYFANAADDTATQINLTAPASVGAGRTVNLTGVIADKFGNGVSADNGSGNDENFKVAYSGPGFVATLPTEAGDDGSFSASVLLGASDSGTGTFTVSYDKNRDGDYVDTGDLVVTKSFTVGAAPAPAATAAASGSTAKIYASVANAAGKWVVVKVNGKFAKSFAGTSAKKVVAVAATAGAKNVSIFVGGVKILGKVVTVK